MAGYGELAGPTYGSIFAGPTYGSIGEQPGSAHATVTEIGDAVGIIQLVGRADATVEVR